MRKHYIENCKMLLDFQAQIYIRMQILLAYEPEYTSILVSRWEWPADVQVNKSSFTINVFQTHNMYCSLLHSVLSRTQCGL